MRIRDLPENTSFYTVIDAFFRDGVGRLWVSEEYEASEAPNKSRWIEIIRTPDGRFHVMGDVLKGKTIKRMISPVNMVKCWEGREHGNSNQPRPLTAKDPGFRYF